MEENHISKEILKNKTLQHFDSSKVISSDLISEGEEEYIVTLKNKEDLEQFYDDLETLGGTDHVPDRCVECLLRRPISRNTHYCLTANEVEALQNDERVLSIIPKKLKDLRVISPRGWEQSSSNWNKSSGVINTHRNWGLLRCIEGQQRTDWGADGTDEVAGIVTATSSGKNVDVVIVDGFINPDHPEMAKNQDGSGGTRVVRFNWYSLNSIVTGVSNQNYPYPSTYTAYGDDHGMHVAGTACGNSQGWARDANVYNLYIYDNSNGATYWIDYIRAFHLTKLVNPETGIRNPTIINNSWGYTNYMIRSNCTGIIHRGTTYNPPFTDAQLQEFGIISFFTNNGVDYITFESWFEDDLADMIDAMDDGVIFVGAAGNSSYKIDSPGGQDYDNTILGSSIYRSGNSFYYHRGSTNVSGGNAICVGAIGPLKDDSKASFSCTGPRVTVYAPGSNIISSVHSGSATDYRNASFQIDKYNGTSMASPQVCGVIACALEQYPRMTHYEAVEYIQALSKNQIFEPTASPYIDQGLSSINNGSSPLTGTESFVPVSNTSVRIVTSSMGGSITSITNTLLGPAGLTPYTTPTYYNTSYSPDDDGFWHIILPWTISFNGNTTNSVYVNTNNYVVFGNSSIPSTYDQDISWAYGITTPPLPKIQISTTDGSAQRVYHGSEGPNYRIRFEGHTGYSGGILGSPTIVWEMVFYSSAPSQIDLHIGANPRVSEYNEYLDNYSLQGSGNRYLYYRKDRPVLGTIQPKVGEKNRKSSGQTWPRMGTLRYKQS